SLHATNEEAVVFGWLCREALGVKSVALLAYADGDADKVLRVADKNPNRAGVSKVLSDLGLGTTTIGELTAQVSSGAVKALLVQGHEGEGVEELPKATARADVFVHVAHAHTSLVSGYHLTLSGLDWVQGAGTWLKVLNR